MKRMLPLVMAAAVGLGIGLGFAMPTAKAALMGVTTQAEEKCAKCGHLPSKPEGDCKCECHKKKEEKK